MLHAPSEEFYLLVRRVGCGGGTMAVVVVVVLAVEFHAQLFAWKRHAWLWVLTQHKIPTKMYVQQLRVLHIHLSSSRKYCGDRQKDTRDKQTCDTLVNVL